MSNCCVTGFNWNGTPTGKAAKIAGLDTYVVGSNADAAILMIHDVYGWTFSNLRLLADHFAREANATVYLVDFFGGEVIEPLMLSDPAKRSEFNMGAFMGRNGKDKRWPEIEATAKELKGKFKKVGAIGYCYGGWAVFQLGGKGKSLIDAISTAHPSALTLEEIASVDVPVQILSPEHDHNYTAELKEYSLKVIPTLGVDFDYQYFPTVSHGFAVKGDEEDQIQKKALERAKSAAAAWFVQYLH